jgi:Zn-dependent protease with chaperone function
VTIDQLLPITLNLLLVFLGFHIVSFIFTPAYQFSKAPNRVLGYYLGKLITSIILKLLLLGVMLLIVPITFPVLYLIDQILFQVFSIQLNWNIYQLFGLGIWCSLIFSVLLMWWEEWRNKQLVKIKASDLAVANYRYGSMELMERLQGIKLFAYNDEKLVAYTYGGILMKPRIVVSKVLMTPGWANPLGAVLLHELNHIERKDIVWGLFTYGLNTLVRFTFKVLRFPAKVLSFIPILSFIGRFWNLIINLVEEMWNIVLGFGNILNVKSEELADIETFSILSPQNLLIALKDVSTDRVGNYSFSYNEKIGQEIINEHYLEYKELQQLSRWEQFKLLLNSTHPQLALRSIFGSIFSERLTTQTDLKVNINKERNNLALYFVIFLFVSPLLFLFVNEIKKNKEYEFKHKEVLEYINYLEKSKQ